MLVRQRLPTAILALSAFTVLGAIGDHRFWLATWFYVGLGTVISATFVEPYFSRPQDAIVNAGAGIGAVAASAHIPVAPLWYGFLGLLIVILLLGVVASVAPESPNGLRWAAFRLSSRLGRATVIRPNDPDAHRSNGGSEPSINQTSSISPAPSQPSRCYSRQTGKASIRSSGRKALGRPQLQPSGHA
jgi:hypothetical protein